MNKPLPDNLFDNCRHWLASQPGLNPWDTGCQELNSRLSNWVEHYSTPICEQPVCNGHPSSHTYSARLWQSLGYHWQQAAECGPNSGVPVEDVVGRLREGRGWQGQGNLGGDPLRDMVLAVAMTLLDNRAPTVFELDYREFCRGQAGKVNHRLSADFDECWAELLDALAGYTKPPGNLEKFEGKCGLRNWLGTVAYNFARRWAKQRWKREADEDPDQTQVAEALTDLDPATRESLALFAHVVNAALEQLSTEDRLLLSLVYIDRMKQKDAAMVLGIHPGNVTRRLQKAQDLLKDNLVTSAEAHFGEISTAGLLDYIKDDPRAFAQALCDALEMQRKADDE